MGLTTYKFQIPIFNDQNLPGRDIIWIFEIWSRAAQALAPRVGIFLVFDIWNFNNSMNFQQSKSPLGQDFYWLTRLLTGDTIIHWDFLPGPPIEDFAGEFQFPLSIHRKYLIFTAIL